MIKRTVEISSGPAHLQLEMNQMIVRRDGQADMTIPCEEIGVLIIDNPAVSYSQQLLTELAGQEAAVIFCGNDHLPTGMLLPLAADMMQSERLRAQIKVKVPVLKQLWKQIVQAKIRNQAGVLGPGNPNHRRLMELIYVVKSGDTSNVEAQASRIYRQSLFPEDQLRHARSEQAPNNLLNYGYAILRSVIARSLCSSGLHLSIGIRHKNKYNPYCLADDLMEPFRPMVDARVRNLWRQGTEQIEKSTKIYLLDMLSDTVKSEQTVGPFMVALPRMTASLYRCLNGREKELEIPEPCSFPDIESYG